MERILMEQQRLYMQAALYLRDALCDKGHQMESKLRFLSVMHKRGNKTYIFIPRPDEFIIGDARLDEE